MRYLYTLLLRLGLPLLLLRLWLKGAAVPAYRKHWRERFGFVPALPRRGVIWVHAVSVGEVFAARVLVDELIKRFGAETVLLTTTTPSGRDIAYKLFGEKIIQCFLPYDLPGAVRRFLDRFEPKIAIVMETEIWPNLYYRLNRRHIPLLLVNARLSERSMRRYRCFSRFSAETIGYVDIIAAQSEADAARFLRLGADPFKTHVSGNMKFDAGVADDVQTRVEQLRSRIGSARPLWLAASTHDGEEALILKAHQQVLEQVPDALLVWVPRHPERAAAIGRLCDRSAMCFQLYSEAARLAPHCSVLLVDTFGVLRYLYALADIAFVGGSLVDRGGHNPIEPAALGVAVLSGPNVANFEAAFRMLAEAGAVTFVDGEQGLARETLTALRVPESAIARGKAGQGAVGLHRGATEAVLKMIETLL